MIIFPGPDLFSVSRQQCETFIKICDFFLFFFFFLAINLPEGSNMCQTLFNQQPDGKRCEQLFSFPILFFSPSSPFLFRIFAKKNHLPEGLIFHQNFNQRQFSFFNLFCHLRVILLSWLEFHDFNLFAWQLVRGP